MNFADWIALGLIIFLLICAVRYMIPERKAAAAAVRNVQNAAMKKKESFREHIQKKRQYLFRYGRFFTYIKLIPRF